MPDIDQCRPYRALIHKEWREQRWKLAYSCVLLFGVAGIGFRSHMCEDDGIVALVLLIGGLCLPLLAAVGVAGTERESGTLPFLQALPLRPGRILSIKMLAALLVCLLPLGLTTLLSAAWVGGRDMSTGHILHLGLAIMWIAANVVVWTVALSVTQRTEGRVGMVGMAIIIAWFMHIMLWGRMMNPSFLDGTWTDVFFAINPCAVMDPIHAIGSNAPAVILSREWVRLVCLLAQGVLLLVLLWWWACRRFSLMGRTAQ